MVSVEEICSQLILISYDHTSCFIFSIHKHRGHQDNQSPDDEALQALGRKINSFNDYLLWAGGQPDYLYAASGDASDFMVSHMSIVANLRYISCKCSHLMSILLNS